MEVTDDDSLEAGTDGDSVVKKTKTQRRFTRVKKTLGENLGRQL